MNKYIFLIFFSLYYCTYSQSNPFWIGLDNTPTSLMINPSEYMENKWHANIPAIGDVSLNYGNTSLSIYDLFTTDDNVDIDTRITDLLKKTKKDGFIAINSNNYISMGIYNELDIYSSVPIDLIKLAINGNYEQNNKTYSFADFYLKATITNVFHIGISRNIDNKYNIGIRAKLYMEGVSMYSSGNKGEFFVANTNNSPYEVYFNDIYINLKASGLDESSDLLKNILYSGNLGAGLDLGFTKRDRRIKYGISLQDIGFVYTTKETLETIYAADTVVRGVILPSKTGDNLDFSEILNMKPKENHNVKYLVWKPTKLNAYYQKGHDEQDYYPRDCYGSKFYYKHTFGVHLYSRIYVSNIKSALTGYYIHQYDKHMKLKISYTIDSFSTYDVSAGTIIGYKIFQFHLAVKNLLSLKNIYSSNKLGAQFGISIAL